MDYRKQALKEKIEVMQGALEGKVVYSDQNLNRIMREDEYLLWNWERYSYTLSNTEEPKGKIFCNHCAHFSSLNRYCKSNPEVEKTPTNIKYIYTEPSIKNKRNNCKEYKQKIIVTIFKTLLTIKKKLSIIEILTKSAFLGLKNNKE